MRRTATYVCATFGMTALLAAQTDGEFAASQTARLHRCAEAAEKAGLPSAARPIYVEVLAAYDPDDERARTALGYVRAGTQWAPSASGPAVPTDDLDPGAGSRVLAVWRRAVQQLADQHVRRSAELDNEGRLDAARWHLERALRFRPGDRELEAALLELSGESQSTLESRIADRTAWIRARVRGQLETDYAVVDAPERRAPDYVAAAGIETRCFESENFVVHGVHPADVLREAARHAERIRALWPEVAAELCDSESAQHRFVLLDAQEDFVRILRTTPEVVADERRREFLIENSSASTFGVGGERARVVVATTPAGVFDSVVRSVATSMSDTRSDFVEEGIGHVAVGWLFGQSLSYYVDLSRANTTSGAGGDFLPPDMDGWADLVVGSFPQSSRRSLLELLLVEFSRFSAVDRAASWSFADYALRRDPALLFACDDASARGRVERVAGTFEKHTGFPIELLEADWRRQCLGEWGAATWGGEGSRLLDCATRDGERWLREFSALRAATIDPELDATPAVGWSAARSAACMQHARYLLENRRERGPDREQTQDARLVGSTPGGRQFASRALIAIGRKPEQVLAEWLDIPDYRDALLDPYLRIVGLFADDGVAVFDLRSDPVGERDAGAAVWPRPGASAVPRTFDVAELGAHVRAELERNDRAGQRAVGFPVTYHTWDGASDWSGVRCALEQRGERLDGILLREVGVRRSSVPGLLMFVPFEPFRTGEVEVRFEEDFDGDGAFEELYGWKFTTR